MLFFNLDVRIKRAAERSTEFSPVSERSERNPGITSPCIITRAREAGRQNYAPCRALTFF